MNIADMLDPRRCTLNWALKDDARDILERRTEQPDTPNLASTVLLLMVATRLSQATRDQTAQDALLSDIDDVGLVARCFEVVRGELTGYLPIPSTTYEYLPNDVNLSREKNGWSIVISRTNGGYREVEVYEDRSADRAASRLQHLLLYQAFVYGEGVEQDQLVALHQAESTIRSELGHLSALIEAKETT